MAGFRRTRYLACFYCGRRTSIRYDGHMRHFECPSCEATNYLDEDGEITDPPVSTTASAETFSPSYASQRGSSPVGLPSPSGSRSYDSSSHDAAAATDSVFCTTCLKNQHLFVSSLAQYFPPDPDHPDFSELERRYFRFRQGLERRYPQVCSECEPAVLERIRQAGYTAKTDHLRRMVSYSRQVRLSRPTYLDAANRLGRWLWRAGLLFQVLWQLGLLASGPGRLAAGPADQAAGQGLFSDDDVVDGLSFAVQDAPPLSAASSVPVLAPLAVLTRLALSWAAANTTLLQSFCLGSTVAGCWWNPYFVQTVRGFTKSLIGISTWYTYQAALVFIRVMIAAVTARLNGEGDGTSDGDDARSGTGTGTGTDTGSSAAASAVPATLGLHAFTALFTLYVYTKAPQAIRRDMRPLFSKLPDAPLTTPVATAPETPQQQRRWRPQAVDERQADSRQRHGLETMSDVLDEIEFAAASPTPAASAVELSPPWGRSSHQKHKKRRSSFEMGSLRIPEDDDDDDDDDDDNYESRRQPMSMSQELDEYYYAEEMDWTPSQPAEPAQSPYRAFSSFGGGGSSPGRADVGQSSSFTSGAFSQTPVKAGHGPFWYKVPPAPASIAKRVLSPSSIPRLRAAGGVAGDAVGGGGGAAAANASGGLFFGRVGDDGDDRKNANGRPRLDLGAASSSSVEFAQPRFFASSAAGGSGNGNGDGDDDAGSKLSDLFSQSFTLGSSSEHAGADGRRHAGERRRTGRTASGDRDDGRPLWVRIAWTAVLALSLGVLHDLREDGGHLQLGLGRRLSRGLSQGLGVGLDLSQPCAKVLETAAVGLCAVTAAALTGESMRHGRRAVELRMRLWPHLCGCLLGLAAAVVAGHMAVQLGSVSSATTAIGGQTAEMTLGADDKGDGWGSYGSGYGYEYMHLDPESAVEAGAGVAAGQVLPLSSRLPWEWSQLAAMHGLVIAHQMWNAAVAV